MKIYNLPVIECKLLLDSTVTNDILTKELYKDINNKKKQIDHVRHQWDSAKKMNNSYEYVYTSSNLRKNISHVAPVSRSFFKLREIIYDYHLDISGSMGCLAEAPGGFIQSLVKHSEEYKIPINMIYGITLVSDDKDIPYWNPLLVKHPKVCVTNGADGTGDLYRLENILDFINTCGKSSCKIVTADGGFDYTSDFEQELSSYKLLYSEIMITLNIQQKGGTFICKMFDLFYISSLQLVYLLYISYEHISFIKPVTSRQSNSEKYIVCRGFKGYNKEISNLLCYHFTKDILPINLPNNFIDIINKYHEYFIKKQINQIDSTLKLISLRKTMDKPTHQQIRLAKEWCIKYKIGINKDCYYLKDTR